ncbi:hypothetical protein B0T20DRAFT_416659 [Sordaria brevicollis]|uniref:Pre-mRNA-splicing factor 38B n=1 Tax=Sordaria brevicollis TaxID=83679 RepID=A0AAE0P9Z9_SORBR|nr:hypothetical protein B0T20DRAFT_416659 [Sordaria brevicollis]
MPNDTIITDDYVAELLAKEASEASIKYSSMGLEAFRSTKPANKAKPNTNFLTRIIRETDSHNAAIKAKETAEAQARLSGLEEAEEKKRLRTNPSLQDIRRRQLGAISTLLSGQKRRREVDEVGQPSTKNESSKDQKKSQSGDKDRHKRGESRRSDDEDAKDRSGERRHHHHHRRHHRDEERSSREERRHRDRSRSRSPRHRERRHRHRSRSPLSSDEDNTKHSRSSHKSRSRKSEKESRSTKDRDITSEKTFSSRRHGRLTEKVTSDSDPLDDLIGPVAPPPADSYPPPVRTRGRGAGRGGAAMDGRFANDYDPSEDMQLDETDLKVSKNDNWDDMVESFRDRQKWLKQGADRLRAAGFSEEDIQKWEKTGPNGEKDIDDVRWTKAGEKREWDRGKEEK